MLSVTPVSAHANTNVAMESGVDEAEPYAATRGGNQTLVFYYDANKQQRNGMDILPFEYGNNVSWAHLRDIITTVEFDESFANCKDITSTQYWFYNCKALTSITGWEYFDTSNVTNMNSMFNGCESLTDLDLSTFNTAKVTGMDGMFAACKSLKSLTFGTGFMTGGLTTNNKRFDGDSALESITFTGKIPSSIHPAFFEGVSGTTKPVILSVPEAYLSGYEAVMENNKFYGGSMILKTFSTDVPIAYALWCEDNSTLYFLTSSESLEAGGTYDGQTITEVWSGEAITDIPETGYPQFTKNRGLTKRIVIDKSFKEVKPKNMSRWFYETVDMTELIGLEYLDTSEAYTMQYMFAAVRSLTTLDLSNFDTRKVTNMDWMFGSCYNLKTIYVGENWSTKSVTSSDRMFDGDTNLVGGKGTAFNNEYTDARMACIDYGPAGYGYLTDKNVPVLEPYAVLSEDNTVLTFYYDEKKTDRGGMDVADRGWSAYSKSVVTVNIHSSMALCTSLTTTASWFAGFENLTKINGLTNLNTINVTVMDDMFAGCKSLTRIEVDKMKTAKVTRMPGMFSQCVALTNLYLSSFDTREVTEIAKFIPYSTSLKTITFGENFTLPKVKSSWLSAFDGLSALESFTFQGDLPVLPGNLFVNVGTQEKPVKLIVPDKYQANYKAAFSSDGTFFGGYFTMENSGQDDLEADKKNLRAQVDALAAQMKDMESKLLEKDANNEATGIWEYINKAKSQLMVIDVEVQNVSSADDVKTCQAEIDALKALMYEISQKIDSYGSSDGEGTEPPKCATPGITFSNGVIGFVCDTKDVKFVSEVTSDDEKTYDSTEITLTRGYTVKVYATKEGYRDSDVATRKLELLGNGTIRLYGDVDGDGKVDVSDIVIITNIILGR